METPENIPVNFNATSSGLKKVSSDFLGLAGDLAEPMLVIASGGTKAQAAWAGFRGVMEMKVLGPLSYVAGASLAALVGINKLAKGFANMGMSSAAGLQSVETRFKAVLRSQELAAARIRENVQIAKDTPYSQDQVNEANRALQILSQGALATKEKMVMIGDATATAGEEFSVVAKWTGRLYDALASGAPIGEASMRLQEMGVITGQTRRTLESMVDSGAGFSEMWGVVEKQLKKSEGAMKDLSKNLEGLQSTYQDTMSVMSAKFSAGFLEGESATLDATTKLMESLTPAVETLGKTFGDSSNMAAKFKASIVESVAKIPNLSTIVSTLAIGITGLLTVMATASAAAMTKFAVGLIQSAAAARKAATGISTLAIAQQVGTAVSADARSAIKELSLALKALAAQEYVAAAGSLKLAAIQLWTTVKTNAASAATVAYRFSCMALSKAMAFVSWAAKSMMASLVANPILLAVAAIAALAAGLGALNAYYKAAQERAEAFSKTTNDLVDGLRAQQRAIATTTDLMRAQNAAVNELTNARKALLDANRDGTKQDIALAEQRVKAMEKEASAVNRFDRSKLAMDDDQKEQRRKSIEDPQALAKIAREERRAKMSPTELARDMLKEADEARDKFEQAQRQRASQKSVQAKQSEAASSKTRDTADLGSEEARLQQLREIRAKALRAAEIAKAQGRGNSLGASGDGEFDPKALDTVKSYTARMEAEEKELVKRIESLRSSVLAGQMGLEAALSGDSDIERLKAKKSLREQSTQADQDSRDAQGKVSSAGKDVTAEQLTALDEANRKRQTLVDLAAKYNVTLNDAGAASRDEQDLEMMTAALQMAEDRVALAEKEAAARKAMADAEADAMANSLDASKAILGLKDLGLAGDLRAIELEKQKLDLLLQRQKIGKEEYDQRKLILDAEAEAANRRANEKSTEAVSQTKLTQYRTEEEAARRIGDIETANRKQAMAEIEERAQAKRRAEKESKDISDDPAKRSAFVAEEMKAFDAAQAEKQKAREEDMARRRAAANEGQQLTYGELRQEILAAQGKTAESKKAERENDKLRDDRLRKDQKQRYVSEGFSAEEATGLADKDVLAQQAARELEKLKSAGTGTVVASSLARIGGGGNVSGTDPVAARLDKTNEYLKQILEKTGGVPGVN